MKILVTGASGMLGRQVVLHCEETEVEVRSRTHADLDIGHWESVKNALIAVKPDVLINCAGIVRGRTDINGLEMARINGDTPPVMASFCDNLGIKMVQISTDCVFAGDGPKSEDDEPNPIDLYGKSKADGEIDYENHLTIRCSFVGIGKRGLLAWLMQQEGDVLGYSRVQWNGMTAKYAAQEIIALATNEVHGIIHIFGEDTNKFELLTLINRYLGLKLNIYPVQEPIEDYRLITVKPTGQPFVPSMKQQLEEMADDYRRHTRRA